MTSLQHELNPFPVPVKLAHLEHPDSYLVRLYTANGFTEKEARLARGSHATITGTTIQQAVINLACARGDLPADAFADAHPHHPDGTACTWCTVALNDRVACKHCTGGQVATQRPHLTRNICMRHKTWVAPGTTHGTQRRVGAEALTAERRFRKLSAAGHIDPYYFSEMLAAARRWEQITGRAEAAAYPALIKVYAAVFTRDKHLAFLDPRFTYHQRYEQLSDLIALHFPDNEAVIADAAWLLLRPAQLAVFEQLTFGYVVAEPFTHDLALPTDPPTAQLPLEPFERYLAPLRTCHVDGWADLNLRLLHHGPQAFPKAGVRRSVHTAAYICPIGHRLPKKPTAMALTYKQRLGVCRICSGQTMQIEWNGAAKTHPKFERFWAADLNDVSYTSVPPSANQQHYFYRCDDGHVRKATPQSFRRRPECPACKQERPCPEPFPELYPELLKQWDRRRNSIDPYTLPANSPARIWWKCPKRGHPGWAARVWDRTRRKIGCPTCANRNIIPGVNDCFTLHPHLEPDWAYDLNEVDPRTLSPRKTNPMYWWRCQLGHPYEASLHSRTRGDGCPYCSSRRVWPGFNDLATKYEAVIAEFHPDNDVDPRTVLPGGRKWRWICEAGHDAAATARNRLKAGGCSQCPKPRRIVHR